MALATVDGKSLRHGNLCLGSRVYDHTSQLQRLSLHHNCDQSYLPQPSKGRVKSFSKVPVNNGCEDLGHGVVIKRVNGYNIHVSGKSI